jgi:membrane protein implicated in regulation of membrane protease activity
VHAATWALAVFASAAVAYALAKALAWSSKRRRADARFQRELALGGRLTPTGERTGLHAHGRVTVEQLQSRIDAATKGSAHE